MEKDDKEVYLKIFGRVQGVFYRQWAKDIAQSLNLFGYAKNLDDGTVEILIQGQEDKLNEFLQKAKIGPEYARVEDIKFEFRQPKEKFNDFKIL